LTGPGVILGDWARGEHYGEDIIGDLQNWAAGWVDVCYRRLLTVVLIERFSLVEYHS